MSERGDETGNTGGGQGRRRWVPAVALGIALAFGALAVVSRRENRGVEIALDGKGWITTLAFSASGTVLVAGRNGRDEPGDAPGLVLWSTATGELLASRPGDAARVAVAFTESGLLVEHRDRGHAVVVRSFPDLAPVTSLVLPETELLTSTFAVGGSRIAVEVYRRDVEQLELQVWDLAPEPKRLATYVEPADANSACALGWMGRDESVVLPLGHHGGLAFAGPIALVDPTTGARARDLPTGPFRQLAVAPARDLLALGDPDGLGVRVVSLLDATSRAAVTLVEPGATRLPGPPSPTGLHVAALALSPDGTLVAAGGERFESDRDERSFHTWVEVWDVARRVRVAVYDGPENDCLQALAFSPASDALAIAWTTRLAIEHPGP